MIGKFTRSMNQVSTDMAAMTAWQREFSRLAIATHDIGLNIEVVDPTATFRASMDRMGAFGKTVEQFNKLFE